MSVVATDPTVDDHGTSPDEAEDAASSIVRQRRGSGVTRTAGLVIAIGALVAVFMLSIAIGSKPIPWSNVWDGIINWGGVWELDTWKNAWRLDFGTLFDYDATNPDEIIVRTLRLPRSIIGILVGAALGAAGAVMQGVSRNPLADPGILGVNAGAALFVVVGIFVFNLTSLLGYVWFAFAGAALASVFVYMLSSLGRSGATPVKLALAGTALTAMLSSITSAIVLLDVDTLDQYRFWIVGSLANRTNDIVVRVAPFMVVGLLLSLCSGRLLNALSLGDDVARSLGQRVALSRGFSAIVVVLLCGAATAAAGPIGFVGLTVPHVARAFVGPDYRWIVPYSAVLAPILLLGSDILGRIIARPGEVQVGVMTAVVGAPFFIALVRRRKLADL